MDKTFRTDQVGGLNRPPELLTARLDFRAGRVSREELRAAEDEAIRDALREQERIGIDVLSDGEMRRDGWPTDLSDAVDGFQADYPVRRTTMPDGTVRELEMHTKIVEARLNKRRQLLGESLPFIKANTSKLFKVTMPSLAYAYKNCYQANVTGGAYPDRAELLDDLQDIYLDEMSYLAAEGVRYIQLDEGFATYIHDGWQGRMRDQGLDPEKQLDMDIAAENLIWDSVPEYGIIRASHLCRGNRTRSGGRGSYDWVAERLFESLHVDRFLLEYDTERAGGFEPLRYLPKGKIAVLGLVSSKFPGLEDQRALMERIEEASRYCPVENLALSAQCGFGGSEDKHHMSISQQWRKLELIVDTAEKVWG